jgi:hypothetical protein
VQKITCKLRSNAAGHSYPAYTVDGPVSHPFF